jgi:hypothetical protein
MFFSPHPQPLPKGEGATSPPLWGGAGGEVAERHYRIIFLIFINFGLQHLSQEVSHAFDHVTRMDNGSIGSHN